MRLAVITVLLALCLPVGSKAHAESFPPPSPVLRATAESLPLLDAEGGFTWQRQPYAAPHARFEGNLDGGPATLAVLAYVLGMLAIGGTGAWSLADRGD